MTIPSVRAKLVERFIFNYRVPYAFLNEQLPDFLEPLEINGFTVGSFCILSLEDVSITGLPHGLGLKNINCALRYAVRETDTGSDAVYVVDRNTDSTFGSFITSLGFPGEHRLVGANLSRSEDKWTISVEQDRLQVFSAKVASSDEPQSVLFDSKGEFEAFLAKGVRSYCPAKHPGRLNIVDLHKTESRFQPLSVSEISCNLFGHAKAEFDSAFRTEGGSYVWDYIGQR